MPARSSARVARQGGRGCGDSGESARLARVMVVSFVAALAALASGSSNEPAPPIVTQPLVNEPLGAQPLAAQPLGGFAVRSYAPLFGFQVPNWSLADEGWRAVQQHNSQATLFVADFEHGAGVFEVEFTVDTLADGDAVGFAFGFEPGEELASDAQWWLVDWRRTTQSIDFLGGPAGALGERGLALSEVRGVPSPEALWGHDVDGPGRGVFELARGAQLGANGWTPGVAHRLRCEVSATRVRVWVDGALEIDRTGDFAEALQGGRLALYDFSQVGVRFRVFAPTVRASATPYGTGTPGLFGVPAFEALEPPAIGGTLRLSCGNTSGAVSDGCVLFTAAPTALDIGIGTLLVEPPFLVIAMLHPLPLGGVELAYPLPHEPALCGLTLFAQHVHTDAGVPGGYAWSRGLVLVFGV